LVTRDTRKTVEFGAIEILLERFPTAARREILRAEMPLGAILRSFRIEYKSKPRAFFEIDSDAVMNAALLLSHSVTLYGRCNEIKNSENHLLAEIVEILPPGIDGR
jgi:chorismate-pyruvate lyase